MELTKVFAENSRAETQEEQRLVVLSSDAAAKRLNLELAQQRMSLLCSEQAKLMELTGDARDIDAKKQRVAATNAQIDEIRAKMSQDEQTMAEFKVRLTALDQEGKNDEAKIEVKMRAFDADKDALQSLIALQRAFLDSELVAAEQDGSTPNETKSELVEQTRSIVNGRRAIAEQRMTEVKEREQRYIQSMNDVRAQREHEMRQIRAELKAVEMAHQERRRFLGEKVSQLEIEEKQLTNAKCELNDQKDCIKMLQLEIEYQQTAVSERQEEMDASESMRSECEQRLDGLRLKNKLRLAALRVRIDSEARVQAEQQAYSNSLQEKLTRERQAVAEQPEDQRTSHNGDDEQIHGWVKSISQGDERADGSVPAQGKQGLAATIDNAATMGEWVTELNGKLEVTQAELDAARSSLEAAEKKAATETARLNEQRLTHQHEVAKLVQYEAGLIARLQKLTSAMPGDAGSGALTTPASSPTRSPRSVVDRAPASAQHTPYAKAQKYLQASDKFEGQTAPDPLSMLSLTAEEEHPMYNPDLKFQTQETVQKRSGFRSRIGGMLEGTRLFEQEAA